MSYRFLRRRGSATTCEGECGILAAYIISLKASVYTALVEARDDLVDSLDIAVHEVVTDRFVQQVGPCT